MSFELIHLLIRGADILWLDFGTDTVPTGQENFVMRGHRAAYITEFDAWMLRDWWMKLKAHNGW